MTLNIVVLDGCVLNPGDISWEGLEQLGDCTFYDRTAYEQTVMRARDAEIVLTNKTVLDKTILLSLPKLKYIGVLATGYDVVDVKQAKKQNVVVTNVPGYGTASVVQAVFALLLELTNRVGLHDARVHAGHWATAKDYCFWEHPITELAGLTLGIVGYGAIGQALARVANAFEMRVIAATRTPRQAQHVAFVDKASLFSKSDIVSLHCPLTTQTKGIINKDILQLMKPSAFLINTSRGGLVCEYDLAESLNGGQIAGAGIDVLSTEPPSPDNPLLSAKNCIITPHVAWATVRARKRLMQIAVNNVRQFCQGHAEHVVS